MGGDATFGCTDNDVVPSCTLGSAVLCCTLGGTELFCTLGDLASLLSSEAGGVGVAVLGGETDGSEVDA